MPDLNIAHKFRVLLTYVFLDRRRNGWNITHAAAAFSAIGWVTPSSTQ
jgi:hypothetical protein